MSRYPDPRAPKPSEPFLVSLRKLVAIMPARRRRQLVIVILLMFLGAAAEMATLGAVIPFLALLAGAEGGRFPVPGTGLEFGIAQASLLFACVAVLGAAVRIFVLRAGYRFSYGLGADLGGEVYRRTLYQPYSWHVARNSSEIIAGITKVNIVVSGIINPLIQSGVAAVISLAIGATLLAIDAGAALTAMLVVGSLYLGITLTVRRRIAAQGKVVAFNETQRIQAVQEGLGGIRDVLLDGVQPIYHSRFARLNARIRQAQAVINLYGNAPRYVVEAAGMVCIVGLAYGLSQRDGGLLGAIPILGALAIGAQRLLPQAQLLYLSWSQINSTRPQLEDVLRLATLPIVEEPLGAPVQATAAPRQPTDGSAPLIALHDVTFRYAAGDAPILDRISLSIPRGARVGIVGQTGSGKSTLIDLIMGLLDASEGVIAIEGVPLTIANRRAWQRRIAHVPQSIFLSDTSIAENIAFGAAPHEIDLERVRRAAGMAQIADHIETLPEGYATRVGERGVRLSGGQRQRLGLARAFYKQVDILVLDEATSALDDKTEEAVTRAIESLGPDITVLMIAHRLSTLRSCTLRIDLSAAPAANPLPSASAVQAL